MALDELTRENEKEIEAIRIDKEENRVYILARSDGGYWMDSNLHYITHDLETGEIISEDIFREKHPEDLKISALFSLALIGLPSLISYFRPSVRERRRRTIKFMKDVKSYKKANRAEFEEISYAVRKV